MSELILNASRANTAPAGTLGRKIASFVLQVAFFVAVFAALLANAKPANAQASQHYTAQEIVDAGHNFFGKTSGALASAIERAFAERGMTTATTRILATGELTDDTAISQMGDAAKYLAEQGRLKIQEAEVQRKMAKDLSDRQLAEARLYFDREKAGAELEIEKNQRRAALIGDT